MKHFNTSYNQTLHIINTHWESWTKSFSEKSYFDGIIFSFVYDCIMHFYIQAVNEFKTFWQYRKRCAINQDHPMLLTIIRKGSSSVSLSDYITYDDKAPATGFSSYPKHKNFNTITADTNLPDRIVFNTETPESHSSFTSFPSDTTMVQQNNEATIRSTPYYEPSVNLYLSGLDFLFPPKKITKCAISVTSPDKQQRLINFSDRIKKNWTTPYQLLESSGEIRCTQIRTGEREYTMFLFYFFTVSLFFSVTWGIYQRCKYRKSQKNNNVTLTNQAQESGVPDPRDNQEHIIQNPRNNQDNIVPDSQDNQANIVPDPSGNQEDPRDNQGDQIVNQEDPIANQEDPIVNQEDPIVNQEVLTVNQGDPLDRARALLDRLSPLERARLEERRLRAVRRRRNYSLGTPPSS